MPRAPRALQSAASGSAASEEVSRLRGLLAQEQGERARLLGGMRDALSSLKATGDSEGKLRGELLSAHQARGLGSSRSWKQHPNQSYPSLMFWCQAASMPPKTVPTKHIASNCSSPTTRSYCHHPSRACGLAETAIAHRLRAAVL